ncbi:MAG: DUF4215 domain-containing protein, partial [Nanoarchaeota archaeon]
MKKRLMKKYDERIIILIIIIIALLSITILRLTEQTISGKAGKDGKEVDLSPPINLPLTPVGLTALADSPSSITLSWDFSADASSYLLERSRSPYTGFEQIYDGSDLSFKDNGLKSNTYYYYRIKARNIIGDSGYTADSWTSTQRNGPIPDAPKGGINSECYDGIDNDNDGLVDTLDNMGVTEGMNGASLGCFGPNSMESSNTNIGEINQFGFTQLTPSSDTIIYYVSSTGNDANDGLSPQNPIKTPIYATAKLRNGYSDWVLFKRGDVFEPKIGNERGEIPPLPSGGNPLPASWGNFVTTSAGRSIAERQVIGSYGSSFVRPIIQNGMARSSSYTAFVGLHFDRPAERGDMNTGMSFNSYGDGILIEDNHISNYIINLDVTGGSNGGYTNMVIRRNIVVDAHSSDGSASQGFSSYGGSYSMLVEANLFDHNGWKEEVPGAEDSPYSHNTYFAGGTINPIYKDSISSRSSNVGLSARSGGFFDNNLLLNNPIGIGVGYFPYNERAVGEVKNNVILDGRNIVGTPEENPRSPQGWGISISAASGIEISNNVVAHQKSGGGPVAILVSGGYSTGLEIHDNKIYDWSPGIIFDYNAYSSPNNIYNNNLQEPNGGQLIYHNNGDLLGTEVFSYANNKYYSASSPESWFGFGTSFNVNFADWESKSLEVGGISERTAFLDPDRDISTYMKSLGMTQTLETFLTEARKQSKYNWREEYTAKAVNDYIREGFKTTEETNTQCGNSVVEAGEQCDDGNIINSDGCSNVCKTETTTTTCTSFTYSQWGACISNNQQLRTVTSSSPQGCTGGNPQITQSCTYQTCGNSVVETGEECDDGNNNDLDSCDNKCKINTVKDPTCSDKIMNGDETGIDCGGLTCQACTTT